MQHVSNTRNTDGEWGSMSYIADAQSLLGRSNIIGGLIGW